MIFFFKELKITFKTSQREKKETPKNRLRAPPNSATNDNGGYTKISSFTVMSVLAKLKPNVKDLKLYKLRI